MEIRVIKDSHSIRLIFFCYIDKKITTLLYKYMIKNTKSFSQNKYIFVTGFLYIIYFIENLLYVAPIVFIFSFCRRRKKIYIYVIKLHHHGRQSTVKYVYTHIHELSGPYLVPFISSCDHLATATVIPLSFFTTLSFPFSFFFPRFYYENKPICPCFSG